MRVFPILAALVVMVLIYLFVFQRDAVTAGEGVPEAEG